MKTIVYFHGYDSNSNTSKVARLRSRFENVFCWDTDIDLDISMPFIENKIMYDILLERIHAPMDLIFVGTSLGAWWAGTLAKQYDAKAFLINPSFEPSKTLTRYNVSSEISKKYKNLEISDNHKYFIGLKDDVLDYTDVQNKMKNVEFFDADHRFNGPEFDIVMNRIHEA